MPEYNKLVRDKIPEIIVANGETPVTRILSDDEYEQALIEKIREECGELVKADTTTQMLEEIADLKTVADALAEHIASVHRLNEIQAKKESERGGFAARIFLERTE